MLLCGRTGRFKVLIHSGIDFTVKLSNSRRMLATLNRESQDSCTFGFSRRQSGKNPFYSYFYRRGIGNHPGQSVDLCYDVVKKATEWPTQEHSI